MGSASTSELRPESRFGPYRIERRIAVGGMAEVFLARHETESSRVVLKVPLADGARSSEANDALAYEARVTETLIDDRIVRTLGFARDGDRAAIVLEWVDGTTLDALLAEPHARRLSAGVALRVVVELLGALHVAHTATDASGTPLRLVHRDVNPHNVLVTREGGVKLTDFGIARSRIANARTRTGTIKGTLRYLAPEQATGSDIDARTDVYAAGLLAFELLCGSPYAEGESELELLRRAENPVARDLPDDVDVPGEVRRALREALARFPEERPATARALAAKLEPFAAPLADAARELALRVERLVPPRDVVPAESSAPSVPAGSRHGPRVAARVAGVVLIVAAALAAATIARAPRGVPPRRTVPTTSAPTALAERHPDADRRAAPEPVGEPRRIDGDASVPRASASRAPRVALPPSTAVLVETPVPTVSEAPAIPGSASTAAPAVDIDRDSVRRQLVRANEAIRSARERGADTTVAQSLSRNALEAYGDGRYAEASALLNRITTLLAVP